MYMYIPITSLSFSLPVSLSQLPEDFAVVYTQVQGEVTVGGVFLRLFIAQPTWVLRKPKEFLIALLEKFGQLTQSSNPDVSYAPMQCNRLPPLLSLSPLGRDPGDSYHCMCVSVLTPANSRRPGATSGAHSQDPGSHEGQQ